MKVVHLTTYKSDGAGSFAYNVYKSSKDRFNNNDQFFYLENSI